MIRSFCSPPHLSLFKLHLTNCRILLIRWPVHSTVFQDVTHNKLKIPDLKKDNNSLWVGKWRTFNELPINLPQENKQTDKMSQQLFVSLKSFQHRCIKSLWSQDKWGNKIAQRIAGWWAFTSLLKFWKLILLKCLIIWTLKMTGNSILQIILILSILQNSIPKNSIWQITNKAPPPQYLLQTNMFADKKSFTWFLTPEWIPPPSDALQWRLQIFFQHLQSSCLCYVWRSVCPG